jgi:hypothetical protein
MTPEADFAVPKRWGYYLGALGLVIFGALIWLTEDSDKAALSAFSAGAILLAGRVRWDLRGEWYYWLLLSIVSVGHVALIVATSISLPSPTIQFAPIVILDFAAIVAGIFGVEHWVKSIRSRA